MTQKGYVKQQASASPTPAKQGPKATAAATGPGFAIKHPTLILIAAALIVSAIAWGRLALPGYPAGLDGDLHVVRSLHLEQELRNGQFPVRWGSEQVWGYGYPTFNFYNPLPYYVTAGLHVLGMPAATAIETLLIVSIAIGAVGMALWARAVWGQIGGFVAATLFVLNPVSLTATYLTMAIGEVVVVSLIPIGCWSLLQASRAGRSWPLFLLVTMFVATAMVLSHNFIGPIGLGLLGLYGLVLAFSARNVRPLVLSAVAVVAALALGAFFWLPAYTELQYTKAADDDIHFERRTELLDLSLRYESFQARDRWYHTRSRDKVGAANIAAVIFAGVALIAFRDRLTRERGTHLMFALGFLGLIVALLIVPNREQLWASLPFLKHAQYSARLLILVGIPAAIVGGAVALWSQTRPLIAGILVIIAVIYGLVFGSPPFTQHSDDENFTSNTPMMRGTADWGRTVLPKWATVDMEAPAEDPQPSITAGEGTIASYEKRSTRINATVNVSTAATLDLPVYYFPGWKAWVDGQELQPEIGTDKGTIQVPLAAGTHQVEVRFTDTPVRRVGNTVTIGSAIAFVIFAIVAIYWAMRRPATSTETGAAA